jgi:hypothetical protein
MSPEHVKSFVTYYLQNLSERTRREKTGTKWGIDWIAYNIGLARFGKTVRLPFLRHGSEGFPKSKTEAEFGIDVAFVSEDGSELIVFVLKDEPLTNTTWTANGFDRDLRMAITPDLSAPGLEHVTRVTITLAYNKDDNQNGIEIYDRFVAAAPTTVGDKVALHFVRWNLSELVAQTIQYLLSPSIVPERFFGQLSYLAAQVADFAHGSDRWEQQLIPNWKRFLNDVLAETDGTRAAELFPVSLIILREHATPNPSQETGWIDLIEWAAVALWKSQMQRQDREFHDAVLRFWDDFYIQELERFYRAHMPALSVEHSIDQLAAATSVGAIAAAQVAYWHVARIGLLSVALADRSAKAGGNTEECRRRLNDVANWLVMLVNANESVLRPVLDIEHIQLFLMFETLRNSGRTQDMAAIVGPLEAKLYLRRISDGGLPFIDGGNSLERVFEQVATRPPEPLINSDSSYFVLALLEICCSLELPARDEVLGRIHRHLVLGTFDVGEPGDRKPLDLVSWIPPLDWAQHVLDGRESGEGVAVHRFGDTRDVTGAQVFDALQRTVGEMRKVEEFVLPESVPLAALILAALRHRTPVPPELWRRKLPHLVHSS